MSKLPPGWAITTISDITEYLSRGKQPKYASYSSLPVINQKAIRWFGIQNEYLKYIAPVQFDKWEPERFIQAGDILWNNTGTGTLGRACLVKQHDLEPPKVVDSHVTIVRPNRAAVESRFLFSWIQSSEVQEKIASLATGATNQIELSRATIASMRIPIAPLNEQKRIADKLDALLARVKVCRDRLDQIPRILENFRQAVLAAAISRKLTEDWRAKNDLLSIQNVFLEDVLLEIKTGPFGSTLHKADYIYGGIPVINPIHINNGKITESSEITVSEKKADELADFKLRAGDIVIARRGVMGRCAVVQPEQEGWLCGTGSIILRVQSQILPNYLQLFLSSPTTVKALEANAMGSTMININQKILLSLQLTLPTIQEQQEIVCRASTLLTYANRIESRYQNALTRVEQLTPTLLSKAFRGELVPQDSNDEPVSLLLERIRAERAAQPNKPKRVVNRSKSNMTKISSQSLKKLIHQLPNNTFSFDELYSDINKKMSGDYDAIKDILFTLLDESEPSIIQIFDSETKAMRFMRRYQ
ncbi:restriction endonuclease subunit S [Coleofasciculus sp. G2-EDA-02]|uniref:restriction endonuclease subunit S n=1 Tax=Coleofasciculus sp. G2-EDA-02 TaxID=3069529 RepID=UPI0032F33D59